jgi:hypothetical protein
VEVKVMRKQLIIIGIIILLFCGELVGCDEEEDKSVLSNEVDRLGWSPQIVNDKAWYEVANTLDYPNSIVITYKNVSLIRDFSNYTEYQVKGSFKAQNIDEIAKYTFIMNIFCYSYPVYKIQWLVRPHKQR